MEVQKLQDYLESIAIEVLPEMNLPVRRKKELRVFTRPLYEVMTESVKGKDRYKKITRVSETEAEKITSLYTVLWKSIALWDQLRNANNNELIARACVEAVATGKLDLWRFVCLPELSIEVKNSKFVKWNYRFDDSRYDTLNPSLPYDAKLIAQLESNCPDIAVNMIYVVDDWEGPYLRTTDPEFDEGNAFLALPIAEQSRALEAYSSVQNDTRDWILQASQEVPVRYTLFFSEIIDLYELIDLFEAFKLELDETGVKLLNQEMEFVERILSDISEYERRLQAMRRIAQYAVEGSILSERFAERAVYLNSEYPVKLVWKKLTALAEIPTLFYVEDGWVKNI